MMQFFGIFCIRRYTGESAAGSSLYIKKKGKIYEKSKRVIVLILIVMLCMPLLPGVQTEAADGENIWMYYLRMTHIRI